MTPDLLAEVRARIPHCTLAVWADMESGTVLAGNADLHYPQEYLDALGSCAAVMLGLPGPQGEMLPDEAVFLSATGSYAFIRASDATGEALCCLCGPIIRPDVLISSMREAMGNTTPQRKVGP